MLLESIFPVPYVKQNIRKGDFKESNTGPQIVYTIEDKNPEAAIAIEPA
jgi:hypothetical protein